MEEHVNNDKCTQNFGMKYWREDT